jgi:hypothetical protein
MIASKATKRGNAIVIHFSDSAFKYDFTFKPGIKIDGIDASEWWDRHLQEKNWYAPVRDQVINLMKTNDVS